MVDTLPKKEKKVTVPLEKVEKMKIGKEQLEDLLEDSSTVGQFKEKFYDKYGIGSWWQDFKLSWIYHKHKGNEKKIQEFKDIINEVKENNKDKSKEVV